MNTPTPPDLELIENRAIEECKFYTFPSAGMSEIERNLEEEEVWKRGADFGYSLGSKSRDAEINRLVYELDKSRDSNRLIITALKEKLRVAREYFDKIVDKYFDMEPSLMMKMDLVERKESLLAREALAKLDDKENG